MLHVAENGLGAERVSGCGVVSAWTEDLHACFVWVLNMHDCIILGSMDIEQEVTKQGFPLDVLHKPMVCEVNEKLESCWRWKTPAGPFESCHSPTNSIPHGSHTLSGICAARAIMLHVAENGLGAELVSGCGVVSAWTEDLHP